MAGNIFLFSSLLSQERLSWIEQSLHQYNISSATMQDRQISVKIDVTFFLTGDSIYSLIDSETVHNWISILSLPNIELVCDNDALIKRGFSVSHLTDRYSDRITVLPNTFDNGTTPFWSKLFNITTQNREKNAQGIGWVQISSPHMYPGIIEGSKYLSTAVNFGYNISIYGFLDGIHITHQGQENPASQNDRITLATLKKRAAEKNLTFSILIHQYCAGARGYVTWNDGQGNIGSSYTIQSAHIKSLEEIINHLRCNQVLLSENAGWFNSSLEDISLHPPFITILITHSPYTTEYTYSGISLATAFAHQGIRTRIVFLEDGVLALSGKQRTLEKSEQYTFPDLLNHLPNDKNIELFSLIPSFYARGTNQDASLTYIRQIQYSDLGNLLYHSNNGRGQESQRIFIF